MRRASAARLAWAYISRPEGPDYTAQQWANCALLVNAHRAGKHLVVIAATLGEQERKAKTAAADQARMNQTGTAGTKVTMRWTAPLRVFGRNGPGTERHNKLFLCCDCPTESSCALPSMTPPPLQSWRFLLRSVVSPLPHCPLWRRSKSRTTGLRSHSNPCRRLRRMRISTIPTHHQRMLGCVSSVGRTVAAR